MPKVKPLAREDPRALRDAKKQQEDKSMSTERVPTRQAAQEMGIGMDQLRWMMETRKIDIGVVTPSRSGRSKRYLIFRSKLDKVLGKDES